MSRMSARQLSHCIQDGDAVILPQCCGIPNTLEQELVGRSANWSDVKIYFGMRMTDVAFNPSTTELVTWFSNSSLGSKIHAGNIGFMPMSAKQIGRLLRSVGRDRRLVSVIQIAPPDRFGFCALGVSATYMLAAIEHSDVILAQVNPRVPRTPGEAYIHIDDAAHLVEVDEPLTEYRGRDTAADPAVCRAIAERVETLIPDGSTIEVGVGSIPEAILSALRSSGKRRIRLHGTLMDGAIGLWEAGVLDNSVTGGPPIRVSEVIGTAKLFDFVDHNPAVSLCAARALFDKSPTSGERPFVAINSAIEIDLSGQVNSEFLDGLQLAGVGGSVDYINQVDQSAAGVSVLAFSSVNGRTGSSRIVRELATGVPTSIPRHAVNHVATEYGCVDLSRMTLSERRYALMGLAAPHHRGQLVE